MDLTPRHLTQLAGEVASIAELSQMNTHRAHVEAQMRYANGRDTDDPD